MEEGYGNTRANVIRRYRRETALTERRMVLSSESVHIRHPQNKLHHRKFDQLFQALVREGKKGGETEKEIVKNIKSYPDRPREKLHHGNFNNIVPMATGREKEKEKEIMKYITKTDNNESKTNAETIGNEPVSFYLHHNTIHPHRDDNLTDTTKNATELVKMTRLTSLNLHIPVLMAFFFLLFLASFTFLYSCFVCMCYLKRKKEREKEPPFTILRV